MKTKLLILLFIIGINSHAQKRPMTIDDLKTWNRINNKSISYNGKYVSYRIAPNKGDANLYLYNSTTKKTQKFERGTNAKLGYNNNLLIYKIAPQTDSLRQKKLAKVEKKDLPKDSLGIYLFEQDSIIKIENIKAYYLANKNSNWLAYIYKYKTPTNSTKIDSTQADSLVTKTDSLTPKKKTYKQDGQRLVILNTNSLESYIFENILELTVSEEANQFAFTQIVKDSLDSAFVYVFDTKTLEKKTIFDKIGKVEKLNIDLKGQQLSFIYSSDTTKNKKYSLWYYDFSKSITSILLDTISKYFPHNWGVSEHKTPYFADSGKRLYFGLAPFSIKEEKDTLLDNEKVKLDIWSWTDKRLQPQQLKECKRDLNKSYLSYYDFRNKTFVQIEDSITKSRNNKKIDPIYFLGKSNQKYIQMASWTPDIPADYFIIDAKTGKKKLLAEKKIWNTYVSPLGKYTLIWDKKIEQWVIFDNKTLKETLLTPHISGIFYDKDHDTPSLRGSNGYIGWSKDEKQVYINSYYNIWEFDLTGKSAPRNLTQGKASDHIDYRFLKLDYEAIYLPSDQWMIRTFDKETMEESFQTLNLKTLNKTVLIKEGKAFYPPQKAKNADKIIWSSTSFVDFPELRISNLDFTDIITISKANPQQDKIYWGKINLTQWTDFNRDTLKGLLILPENFDANKKYPVIIYFYEKYSENLNVYWTPNPSRSIINFPFYASNGYVIFIPDINYRTDLPGKDAYNAIVSGTQHINKLPFVNKTKIGIQGQSWGGYQVAYLVTQTNLYACAMSGAPVSNMTSAYGGIRWASGMSRMFQYEHTQSRIGGNLWNSRDKYIENSPIFFADRVETPLLIMHNDGDGAVPWYQGIEYFVALRRLNKPAWLLNYNGDEHNLTKWPNRVDLTKRMFSFFEYYLKDKKIPLWMKNGLPATKKGKELRY